MIFITAEQLAHEVRSLLYLAYATNRSLIIPNVLGPEVQHEDFVEYFEDKAIWPWFRIPFYLKNYAYHHIKVIEPSYYWRIARDYFTKSSQRKFIPTPVLVNISAKTMQKTRLKPVSILEIENMLLSKTYKDESRLVINLLDTGTLSPLQFEQRAERLMQWASDSIGDYEDYQSEAKYYQNLPRLNQAKYSLLKYPDVAPHLVQHVRLCQNLFEFDRGNRSCFDKCD